MSSSTAITVRVLAYGGKFVGEPVGFAKVEIFRPDRSDPLASGLTNQGLIKGTDGSGVTELIMGQPYLWGTPINYEQATAFTAEIPLAEPTVLLFVATSMATPQIKEYSYRLVVPGVPLTGDRAVVLVLHGLLTDLVAPAGGTVIPLGTSVNIMATVRMMCGCKIENHYWPVANFNVQAIVVHNGQTESVPLDYAGTPSEFSANYSFTSPGSYQISILAVETDGNVGSTAPVTVEVR